MKLRPLLASVAILAIAFGAAGCNLITPQGTTIQYAPGNGVSGDVGDIGIHNAMLVQAEDGSQVNLVLSFTNDTDEDVDLRISVGLLTAIVTAEPGVTVIGVDEPLLFQDVEGMPGSTVPVLFELVDGTQTSLNVQIFTGENPGLETLAPEPYEEPEPTATPTPSATDEAQTEASQAAEEAAEGNE